MKIKKKTPEHEAVRRKEPLPRLTPSADSGLTGAEALRRLELGYNNFSVEPPTKTVGQIVKSNLLTYFNLIFFILGGLVIAVGAYRELTFLAIIILNILAGIFQEIRSKQVLDKLSFLSAPKGTAIRDGEAVTLPTEALVLDDIVVFSAGNQIYADAVVVQGAVQVNEALITGEADEITKKPGDTLLSGSFILSGECRARLDRVGADSYVSKLSLEAKKAQKAPKSEMIRSLNKVVGFVGVIIIPVGILLYWKQLQYGQDVQQAVISVVGALIGMIPEGLYLLTTAALAVSVMRLARKRTLVHEMRCIETLARVNVLCVDKTGTVTENKMTVRDIVPLCEDRFIEDDIRIIMSDYVGNMGADNETMIALKKYFRGTTMQTAVKTRPFSSSRKYGGVSYAEDETYLLGAPEVLLESRYGEYADVIETYSKQGCRVLLLALYDGDLDADGLHAELMPLSLILLTNKIRKEAPDTFAYFSKQGVAVKVISGDNPVTVSQVAVEAGIENARLYVDARTLDTPQKIQEAAAAYTVFGRVTPQQKRQLIRALKAEGNTVAMTGDGVNDVLALKDADCSIAMASGSDVACHVSQLVLLNSNFAAMPSVVAEGRRVINNIERSASLFLAKNIFSLFLALISISATLPYPISASQMSLVSGLTIGFPAFVLALEPNENQIKGHFLRNVLNRALPAGLTNVVLVLGVIAFSTVFSLPLEEMSTISTLVVGAVGIMAVFRVCQPFNRLRTLLLCCILAGLLFSVVFLREMFSLSDLSVGGGLILAVFVGLIYPLMTGIRRAMDLIGEKAAPVLASLQRELNKRRGKRRGRSAGSAK